MCQQATKLTCIAASSNETYMIYMDAINELFKKLSEVSKHALLTSQKEMIQILIHKPLVCCFSILISHKLKVERERADWKVALSYPKIRRKGFVPYVTSQDMTNEFVLNLNPKRKKIEWNNPGTNYFFLSFCFVIKFFILSY